MAREEEIIEASIDYQIATNPKCIAGESFADFAHEMNVNQSFIEGAKWADQHPRKELVDKEKVEQWIIGYFEFLNDAGKHHFKIDKFIENFRLTMEE